MRQIEEIAMLDTFIMSIAFAVLFITFWVFEYRTRYFSTRYFLQIECLFGIALAGIYLFIRLTSENVTIWSLLVALVMLVIAIYHGGLAIIKLRESDTRYRWIHKANRAVVTYGTPHERIALKTDDGERIQAIKVCNPYGGSNDPTKAVIVCHGAGRSKNTLPIVQTCKVLATKYDVFTFDFRGHMESSGVFKADGDTEYDLKAMIEYVKNLGYQKIAVFGWSIGAWTALLSASRGRPIDAIIAGSPPPYNMSTMFYVRGLEMMRTLHLPLLAGVAVVRNMWTTTGKHILNISDFVRNLPHIPILMVYNEYDYTLKIPAEEFEKLIAQLPFGAETMKLPGRGHLFDWPNTYFMWQKMFDWLGQHL
jgi:pimeloyl-ACP methyl ester carboxylesterase